MGAINIFTSIYQQLKPSLVLGSVLTVDYC